MLPAMVTAPIIPMSLYLNTVLQSCFRITKYMSSYKETMIEKDIGAGIVQEKSQWLSGPKNLE